MRKGFPLAKLLFIIAALVAVPLGCDQQGSEAPVATTGVKKATARVQTNAKGRTTEQENIISRLAEDNRVGSIKHLYVISAMSGQTILYSTVKGKVTSSGKRLSPYSVAAGYLGGPTRFGIEVDVGGDLQMTSEVLQDDGTYGSSIPYVYWWDTKGVYHQHYVSGGQILHVSSKPINVKSVIINMESVEVEE